MYNVVNSGSSFTCPTGTDKAEETFSVEDGDMHTFKTNEAPKYGKNMKCKVNYIMEASCNKMTVSCKLKLGTGDFFYVQRDDITKKYDYTTNTFSAEYKNKQVCLTLG